jgi:hypothetical protein
MAKVYASASSPELMERKWQEVMDAYSAKSVDSTRPRVARAFHSEPFQVIARIKVNETDALTEWIYAGLMIDLLLAAYSHLSASGSPWHALDPIVVMAFLFASYVLRRCMRAKRWSI